MISLYWSRQYSSHIWRDAPDILVQALFNNFVEDEWGLILRSTEFLVHFPWVFFENCLSFLEIHWVLDKITCVLLHFCGFHKNWQIFILKRPSFALIRAISQLFSTFSEIIVAFVYILPKNPPYDCVFWFRFWKKSSEGLSFWIFGGKILRDVEFWGSKPLEFFGDFIFFCMSFFNNVKKKPAV